MPKTFHICAYTPPLPSQKPPFPLFSGNSNYSPVTCSAFMEVPEYLVGGYYDTDGAQFSPDKQNSAAENFAVDEYLLNFSNEDMAMHSGCFDNVAGNCCDSSTVTAIESCNSSASSGDNLVLGNFGSGGFCEAQFSNELCIPCDDLAELEWLSNFVEGSFSTEEIEKDFQAIPFLSGGISTAVTLEAQSSSGATALGYRSEKTTSFFHGEALTLPGKARSKRSRGSPCDWSTRVLRATAPEAGKSEMTSGRKCQHCAAEKTPQWRTGPMGPKTLCNACGVRYKSGRLVPEYRPAASPTFMSTKHSNSHRKVMELRRQNEVEQLGRWKGGEEYLIHRHNGGDLSRMM
ncbi:GATA transcription factor 9-like [Cucurbita maxima]|uniref:GATA transcription factor 9-like n=1 Tax=Cucurbita maxima TaxID=3661 RepID=A0A6J1IP77_CUCMA|nr:GATA transcription factor 9-like [Cucurbita maxima]